MKENEGLNMYRSLCKRKGALNRYLNPMQVEREW